MTINIISEKEEGNFETDDNPTNAINGKGSNVNVHFNPESNPDIPTLNRKTGRVSNKKRPSQVGLAHEMIHGDRSMRGVAIEYSESESYSYMNNRGQRVMETLSKEEAATVGLNHVKKNDITENDIRKDQGLNPREHTNFDANIAKDNVKYTLYVNYHKVASGYKAFIENFPNDIQTVIKEMLLLASPLYYKNHKS